MGIYIFWSCIPLFIAINYIFAKREKKEKIYNKNILIIGGSSGLGYAFANVLTTQSNNVTATSRNKNFIKTNNEISKIKFIHCDVFDSTTFEKEKTIYDIIFYCAGLSVPGNISSTSFNEYKICAETNYLGMIKILKHYINRNKKPFDFVLIGSTLATFFLQGYSTYSPTKTALHSYFFSSYDELKKINVNLHFFSPSNMNTRGFNIENTTKLNFTKAIEKLHPVYDPEICANYFLKNFQSRKIIVMDWFTYFHYIRYNCEKIIDYLLFPFSIFIVFFTNFFVHILYKVFG